MTSPQSASRSPEQIPEHAEPLGRSILKNATAQVIGRNFIALVRLALASLILRQFGKETFAEYSLLLVLLTIAEWVLDFGTTDVFVRDICSRPLERLRLLHTATAVKTVQLPAAFLVLIVLLAALRYSGPVVASTLVGGAGMVFMAGVTLYRIAFRASMRMGCEVAAELVSVLVMIPFVFLTRRYGGGLLGIAVCHFASRAVFLAMSGWLDKGGTSLSMAGVGWADITGALRASWAIGAIGFLVVLYETLDVLVLSRVSTLSEVASYSGAQRYVLPILMSLTAVGSTFYPVMASFWPTARGEFEAAFQRGLDSIMLLTGAAVCAMLSGAEFLTQLLGPGLHSAAPVLRILALVCVAKALSSAIGPAMYVVRKEQLALRLVGVTVALKAVLVVVLAREAGSIGVAWAALGADAFSAAGSVLIIQRFTGYRVRWAVSLKVTSIAIAAAAAAHHVLGSGFAALVTAVSIYAALVVASGALAASDLRWLLRRRGFR